MHGDAFKTDKHGISRVEWGPKISLVFVKLW